MKMTDPDFDAAANPMTVAQAQGFTHFTAAFGHCQGCLREKAQWRNLMARTLELAQQHPAVPKTKRRPSVSDGGHSVSKQTMPPQFSGAPAA
eukprot:COSAG06_NODE_2480_length_6788_cov_3.392084_2_plen_92_part_00